MITTSVICNGTLLQQKVVGDLREEELQTAMARFEPSEWEAPVLWDLTETNLELSNDDYSRALTRLFQSNRERHTHDRRGILVGDETAFHRVRDVLRAADPPWPWAVFVDRNLVIAWLRRR